MKQCDIFLFSGENLVKEQQIEEKNQETVATCSELVRKKN